MPLPSFARFIAPVLLIVALKSSPAKADFIYDNSTYTTNVPNVYDPLFEYGDEIVLGKGTSRVMGQFLFEDYGDFVPAGDETARIRLYKNDGPGEDPTPGTVLYDSGTFSLSPGYQTKTISGLNISLSDDITWTVQFSGLVGASGDRAGLIFRDPPTVGSSYNDVWIKSAGTWQLYSWNGSPVANFAARIVSLGDSNSISIRRDASQVVIEWTGLSILQVSTKAAGPYTDLANVRNRYVVDTTKAAFMFWRLRD